MPEASPVRNLKAKMSEAAAPRQTSPMQIPKVSEVRSSTQDPKTEEEDPTPSTTGAMDRACQCQTARSRLSGRLAIIRSESSIAEDSEDSTCIKSTVSASRARPKTRQPEETPRRDRGDGPSLSMSGSSGQTVEAARCRSKRVVVCRGLRRLHGPKEHRPNRSDSGVRRLWKALISTAPPDNSAHA